MPMKILLSFGFLSVIAIGCFHINEAILVQDEQGRPIRGAFLSDAVVTGVPTFSENRSDSTGRLNVREFRDDQCFIQAEGFQATLIDLKELKHSRRIKPVILHRVNSEQATSVPAEIKK